MNDAPKNSSTKTYLNSPRPSQESMMVHSYNSITNTHSLKNYNTDTYSKYKRTPNINRHMLLTTLIISMIVTLLCIIPIGQALIISKPSISIGNEQATFVIPISDISTANITYYAYPRSENEILTVLSSEPKKNHTIDITNIQPGLQHVYSIVACKFPIDPKNPNCDKYDGSFVSPDANPPPAPQKVTVRNITQDKVVVDWTPIDESIADDIKQYIIYLNGDNVKNATRSGITITNLTGSKTYYVQVAGNDKSGNIGDLSEGIGFTTSEPDLIAPSIYETSIIGLSNTSTIILWKTDELSNSVVYYGLTKPNQTTLQRGMVVNHTVTLSKLIPDKSYKYIISSCDSFNNCKNSSIEDFISGGDVTPPILTVKLPKLYNANTLPINGTTEPLARILIYLNGGETPVRVTQASLSGNFYTDIPLNTKLAKNIIKIAAEDGASNRKEESFEIMVDADKPVVSISSFPTVVTSSSFSINGTISEDVVVTIYVVQPQDPSMAMPKAVANLTFGTVDSDSVELEWSSNRAEDNIDFYRIYRDGKLVATTTASSFNDCVKSSSEYTYYVTAVSNTCREGIKSDIITTETTIGKNCTLTREPEIKTCDGTKPLKTAKLKKGEFKQSITVKPGTNHVTVQFSDSANNTVEANGIVLYDEHEPRITWTNLRQVTPVYDSQVTIKGHVDDNATVSIVVNNDTTYIGKTDENGNFSIDIELEELNYEDVLTLQNAQNQITGRSIDSRITGNAVSDVPGGIDAIDYQNYYSYLSGDEKLQTLSLTATVDSSSWKNNIVITAIDTVGRNSTKVEGTIEYKLCGQGSYWGITLSDPQPTMLLPRHLLNGIAQISFNYKLEWLGGSGGFEDEKIPSVTPRVTFRKLSTIDKEKWDEDWFLTPRPYFKTNTNRTEGYIVIKSKALNKYATNTQAYRRDLSKAIAGNKSENFTTLLEMEKNISDHRTGTGGCIVKTFGCVKLPLQIELSFSDPVSQSTQNNLYETTPVYRSTRIVQRQCWDVEISIDKRIDPAIIPKDFLRSAVLFLNSSITLIDNVLVPLNTIKEYTLYACMGSWVVLSTKALNKRFKCEFSGTLKQLSGTGFKPAIAEMGLCEYFYGNDENSKENLDACKLCSTATKEFTDFEVTVQSICDRMACPSAPSFMKYVQDMTTKSKDKRVTVSFAKNGNSSTMKQAVTLIQKSDCKDFPLTFNAVEMQYREWMKFKEEKNGTVYTNPFIGGTNISGMSYESSSTDQIKGQPSEQDCTQPHSYNPNCCVYEYMHRYDTVCGLPNGLLFDEMKESYCVAGSYSFGSLQLSEMEKATGITISDKKPVEESYSNKETKQETDSSYAINGSDLYQRECDTPTRKFWNAFAGICEKDAQRMAGFVQTGIRYNVVMYNPIQMGTLSSRVEAEQKNQLTRFEEQKSLITGPQDSTQIAKSASTTPGGIGGNIIIAKAGTVGDANSNPYTSECLKNNRPGDDTNIYYAIIPNEDKTNTAESYEVYRGYVASQIGLAESVIMPKGSKFDASSGIPVGSSKSFIPVGSALPLEWFTLDGGEQLPTKQANFNKATLKSGGYGSFKTDLLNCADVSAVGATESIANGVILAATTACKSNPKCTEADIQAKLPESMKNNTIATDAISNLYTSQKDRLVKGKSSEEIELLRASVTTNINTKLGTTSAAELAKQGTVKVNDAVIRKIYQDIQSKLGIADKPEIVDPSSSFLRSVQCLCLPGVTGYLKLWRSMMVAVKACFQTILITGDGNPGICRAVLSQYVCDFIYDAIRCFSEKYGQGFERSYSTEDNPGNILGALTSSGRDVERFIAGRYGNSQFYQQMFGERQLVHALCLWFFTGTFDFDFKAISEGEFSDIPVASQGLLAPCQRRFISYNDAAKGRTVWNYYFGVGLVAGSEVSYRLYLQCSNDVNCDYGYGTEICDCAHIGEVKKRAVNLRGASPSLKMYDVLEDEYDGTIEDNVRYDKVILEYTYRDKDNQRTTNNVTCDIKNTGGNAPGFCQFDIGQGMYRCGINIGEETYTNLISVTDSRMGYGYKVGDAIVVNTLVSQKVPSSAVDCQSTESCQYTKYMALEIKNHKQQVVLDAFGYGTESAVGNSNYNNGMTAQTSQVQVLLGNGQTPYALSTSPTVITNEMLSGSIQPLSQNVQPTNGNQIVYLPGQAQTTNLPCDGLGEVTWSARVIIFDSVDIGGMYTKSNNIAKFQGTLLEKTIPIKIRCEASTQQLNAQTVTQIKTNIKSIKINGQQSPQYISPKFKIEIEYNPIQDFPNPIQVIINGKDQYTTIKNKAYNMYPVGTAPNMPILYTSDFELPPGNYDIGIVANGQSINTYPVSVTSAP